MDTAALKVVADGSAQLITWALALAAGSVAALIGTGYLQPKNRWRLIYLLFLPAWLLVGCSVFYGHQISREYMAAALGLPAKVPIIGQVINKDFGRQLLTFEFAIAFFALWLLLFLIWWIFFDGRP